MNDKKEIVSVAANHIEPGIKKYEGKIDPQLSKIISAAGLTFTPYLFNDGRILLVLPHNTVAFLYSNKDVLFNVLNLI